jgi:hypothetical protein
MRTYIRACSLATTLALVGASSATASSLESLAGAVGGQSTCGTFGPPDRIGSLFGSIFSIGDVGNGISDCGMKGSIQTLTAAQGPLTSTNSVSATVGGGPYTGTSSATSNYGILSAAAHGTNLGVTNTLGFSQSGGFAIFNDELTFTSPTQTNGSSGTVVYTFTIDAALTTPVPTPPFASQNFAELAVQQGDFVQGHVFNASTYATSDGRVLNDPSYPGFTVSQGSVEGSGQFSSVPLPFVWGVEENLTVGLATTSTPSTGATLDSHVNGVLTGIAVYNADGSLNGNFKIRATSGSVYTADGVSLVPEPQTYALLLTGLVLVGFVAKRRSRVVLDGES